MLEFIVRNKGRGQVVMAGATYDAERDTERFLNRAAEIGADFGLVLSPGYFRKLMTEDVLFAYFSSLADRSPIPLLLYNAPGFCGVTLTPALVGRLAGHPNIVGMKDSAASGIENFLQFESPSFHVLAGSVNFLFRAMMGGSIGGTVSLANSFPGVVASALPVWPGTGRSQWNSLPGTGDRDQPGDLRPLRSFGGKSRNEPGRSSRWSAEAAAVKPDRRPGRETSPALCEGGPDSVSRDILAIDVGTTAMKLAVFSPELEKRCEATRRYDVNIYCGGRADIAPAKWWWALEECCAEISEYLSAVGVVSLSVTTPGFLPMAEDGAALGPAILFFDGRSHVQARAIRHAVGEEKFLKEACNLPVSGGSGLCSMLWIRENQPDVWAAAAKFGGTNTHVAKRLTGNWCIDPSTISISGLYHTAKDDLTWNEDVLDIAGIPKKPAAGPGPVV